MLVLTRRADESTVIVLPGCVVKVTVISIDGAKVRLGFEAPNDVPIYRSELMSAVEARNEAAKRAAG